MENSDKIIISDDVDVPKIEDGEALVKVVSLGLCASDLKIVHGILKPPYYPFIIGHEIMGKVVDAKPSNAVEKRLIEKIEDENKGRVIVYIYIGCGYCEFCRRGEMNLCSNVKRIGFEVNGGLAEYVKVPIRNLVPLPASLGPESAVLADAGATVLRAIKKAKPKPGQKAVVMGVGGLGSMAIQILKLYNVEIIAIDKVDEKLEFARKLGADATINISTNKVDIKDADIFVDLVGNIESQRVAVSTLKKKGILLQLGYGGDSYSNIRVKDLVYNELRIIGTLGNSISDLYEIVKLASKNLIKTFVTDEYKFDEINRALYDLEYNKIKGRALIKIS